MGIVYKAQDTKLDRFVALKFLSPHLTSSEEEKQRFIHEAKAASALQHNNICAIHEIDETDDNQIFICMDYYEGETLDKKIKEKPLPVEEAIEIAIQIAQGLAKAHEKEIVHRDIKPANIMLTADGIVKILDFGLAKLSRQTKLTKEGTTLGTIAYMSPEQTRGDAVDARSDIWSLGVILYEMITGQIPFKGDYDQAVMYAIMNEEPVFLRKVNPVVPPEMECIVHRTLEKNLKLRYSSSGDVLKALKQVQADLSAEENEILQFKSVLRSLRKPIVVVSTVFAAIALCFAVFWFLQRSAKIKWAREEAVPEIIRLVEEGKYIPAFQLAQQAEKHIPNDPLLTDLWTKMSGKVSIQTDPSGSYIYRKNYEEVNGSWEYLGQSPLDSVRIPFGYFRWKIEKEGYQTVEAAGSGYKDSLYFKLAKMEDVPPGMIRVPGGKISEFNFYNIGVIEPVPLDEFWIDKYEVTNVQYKKFIESGGYQNQEYWKHEFVKDSRVLSWNEAMEEFRDATGRPGPSTWQIGSYPEGEHDYPVTGISWYEAAAYAEFAGKSLPTIHHWRVAAGIDQGFHIIPLSHFGGNGPVQVGTYQGMSPYDTYDMAGNAREWCRNQAEAKYLILGGAWNDPHYMFHMPYAQSAFNRTPGNGFRCIKCISPESCPDNAADAFPHFDFRDYGKEKSVSDEIFRIYKGLFSYDKTELNPVIESSDDSSAFWIKEKITYNAAYGNERIIAYLFLPQNTKPPYQTVVYFPGTNALKMRSSENLSEGSYGFMVKSGRAVLFPIYKSTYERYDGFVVPPSTANSWRNQMIFWYKDLARSIDYLETRQHIDGDKIAFFGASLGAVTGVVLVTLENRIQASILYVGGFALTKLIKEAPEVDQINFAPRMTTPTLMLNGRYDFLFPFETSQVPMYRLLGMSEEHKAHKVYETGHGVPRNEKIKETLNWLDRYLGPVD
jgi:serine/threonine protein kinase/formylglycine-generating enzyme required for sulfatase activity/dienelactone hydrolase